MPMLFPPPAMPFSTDTYLLIFHHPLQYFLTSPPFHLASCSLCCGSGRAKQLRMDSRAQLPGSVSSPILSSQITLSKSLNLSVTRFPCP